MATNHREVLEEIRERLMADRRQAAVAYLHAQTDQDFNKINDVLELQGKIEVIDRAISDETRVESGSRYQHRGLAGSE